MTWRNELRPTMSASIEIVAVTQDVLCQWTVSVFCDTKLVAEKKIALLNALIDAGARAAPDLRINIHKEFTHRSLDASATVCTSYETFVARFHEYAERNLGQDIEQSVFKDLLDRFTDNT